MMSLRHHYVDQNALVTTGRRPTYRITRNQEEADMDLNGKRIVVLGGSSGIGLATAQAAARQGAAVVIASSRQSRVDEALAALPAGAEGHALDLTDADAVQALFARIGTLDHLVFTAGESLQLGPLAETDLAAAQRFFQLRYWGAVTAAKAAGGRIQAGGSITFTSGAAGRRPRAGWSIGASVCMAMEGLTRALAVELAPVRVNIVCPGFVRSPLWDGMPESEREALYEQVGKALPVGHVGEPKEIAEAYIYAMRQSYGTGQVIVVDGGGVLV
jgi:NAD(P)-dependent dehydrogenase (short-subunit alcohol dehydrogenase family)